MSHPHDHGHAYSHAHEPHGASHTLPAHWRTLSIDPATQQIESRHCATPCAQHSGTP